MTLEETSESATPNAEDIVRTALNTVRSDISVLRVVDYAVVVDTGRRYSDGSPVTARVWIPPSTPAMVAVGDGGSTYTRVGMFGNAPDYVLSVRRELMEHLPVRDIRGQVVITAKSTRTAEAISLLADSCVALDVAVIVANHLRPKV
ncbi:MAG: hypothetical protein E6R04_06680 [Spirochaetes bacterium]|nr:MAG: hypothetical protein E6R04_06680 [Spirochaetota bacterium]